MKILDNFMLLIIWIIKSFDCIQIDNGVVGEPTISCGSDEINFWVNTQKPFEGKIYVKGEFGKPECTMQKGQTTHEYATSPPVQGTTGSYLITFRPIQCPPCPTSPSAERLVKLTTNAFQTVPKYSAGPMPPARAPRDVHLYETKADSGHIKIRTGTCNVKRERMLNPAGISLTVTVVVSFHQLFITKVDRAYQLRCFYMEAEKHVSSMLDVSMPSTTELSVQAAMPTCQYTIRRSSTDGPEIKYAKVGDSVYHTWQCSTTIPGMYGMLIHSCSVDDGRGKKVQVLNNKGCTLDKFVIGNIEYNPNLLQASVESHVFKFADRAVVDFQCVITICLKSDNQCDGVTPPNCPQTRQKRELVYLNNTDVQLNSSDWNLHAQKFTVVDIDENIPSEELRQLEERSRSKEPESFRRESETTTVYQLPRSGVCLSAVGFGMLISSCTFVLTLVSVIFSYIYLLRFKYDTQDFLGMTLSSKPAAWLSLSKGCVIVPTKHTNFKCG